MFCVYNGVEHVRIGAVLRERSVYAISGRMRLLPNVGAGPGGRIASRSTIPAASQGGDQCHEDQERAHGHAATMPKSAGSQDQIRVIQGEGSPVASA